jgi:hypothetical protein
MVPYISGGIGLVVWGLVSDRMNELRWNLLAACVVSAVGLVIAGLTILLVSITEFVDTFPHHASIEHRSVGDPGRHRKSGPHLRDTLFPPVSSHRLARFACSPGCIGIRE